MTDPVPLYAAIASGLMGFIGSWLGAQIALSNFKRQRAFEKQLDWYERAARALNDLAEKIDIAATFQDQPQTPQEDLHGHWSAVQQAHLELSRAAQDAALYASDAALKHLSGINKMVQEVADKTDAFDPPNIVVDKEKSMSAIYNLPAKLEKGREPLLLEARRHLGLKN
jgi:TPR repeat protein